MASTLMVVWIGLLSAVLLGGVVAVASAPTAVYASASRTVLSKHIVELVRQAAPSGFEESLEPVVAAAWTWLVEGAESAAKAKGTVELWADVLAAFQKAHRVSRRSFRHPITAEAKRKLRVALDEGALVLKGQPPATMILTGQKLVRRRALSFAWVGIRQFGPRTAGFALERVGASATSGTVLGLLVAMPGAAVTAAITGAAPDLGGWLGAGATWGAAVGLCWGAVALYQGAKAMLVDSPAAWVAVNVAWAGSAILLWVLMGIGLAMPLVIGGGAETSTVPDVPPVTVDPAVGSTIVWVTIAAGAGFSVLKGLRANGWRRKSLFLGAPVLVILFLLSATLPNDMFPQARAWIGGTVLLVATGALAMPLILDVGKWVWSRIHRGEPRHYLGMPGVATTWVLIYLVAATVLMTLYTWIASVVSRVPSFLGLLVILGALLVVVVPAGAWHYRRNARLNSDERIMRSASLAQPSPPADDVRVAHSRDEATAVAIEGINGPANESTPDAERSPDRQDRAAGGSPDSKSPGAARSSTSSR